MANNKDSFSFDDDDFSSDYWSDSGSGGFAPDKQSTGARSSITEFSGSFISGVKEQLLDPNTQRRMLYNSLPEGYATAHDALVTSKSMVQSIASEAKHGISDVVSDISGSAKSLMKGYGKYLPKSLREKIQRKLDESTQQTYYTPSETETFNDELDQIMKDSADFQRTALALTEDTQVKTSNNIVAAQVSTTAAVSITNQLLQNAVKNGDRLTALNFAETKIARKNAEITFKTHIVQRKQLDVLEQMQYMQKSAFAELIKNTGLPDTVKITEWERTSTAVKGKLIGMATARATRSFGNVAATVAENLKNKMAVNLKNGSGLAGVALARLVSQMEQSKLDDTSTTSTIGKWLGKAGILGSEQLFSKKYGGRIKSHEGLKAQGDRVLNFMDGAAGSLGKSLKGFGKIGEIAQFLGFTPDMLSSDPNRRDLVRSSALGNLEEATTWNKRNDIALTEVIPGQLAMINQTLDIMRTGDANTPLKRYDYEKGIFSTNSSIIDNARERMFKKSNIKKTGEDVNQLLNTLDPNNVIAPADRKLLAKHLLEVAHDESGFIDAQSLMHAEMSPIAKYDAKAAVRIAEALRGSSPLGGGYNAEWDGLSDKSIFTANLNGTDEFHSSLQSANKQLKNMRVRMPNYHKTAIDFTHSGYHDLLAEEGLIKWNDDQKQWNINNDAFFDQVFGGESGSKGQAKPPVAPSTGGLPKIDRPDVTSGASGQDDSFDAPIMDHPRRPSMKDRAKVKFSSFQAELLETLERVSTKPASDVGNQLLEAIRERLEMGIPTGGPAMDNPQAQNKKTRWYRKLLEGSSKAGQTAKGYFKHTNFKMPNAIFNNFSKNPLKIFRGINDLPGRVLLGGKNRLKTFASNHSETIKQMGDIFIQGKEDAIIKSKELLNGDYIDATTGKVIQSFKDIKGPIKDKTGQFVVSAEDYAKGIFTVIDGKRKSIVGGALKSFGSMVKRYAGFQAGLAAAPFRVVSAVKDAAKDFLKDKLDGVTDIFVAGEKNVRLIGSVLKSGGYFNRDGTVIRKLTDIKGDVVDASNRTVLSLQEMTKGLVDSKGERVKVGLDKMLSMASAAKSGFKKLLSGNLSGLKRKTINIRKLFGKKSKSAVQTVQSIQSSNAAPVDVNTMLNARATDVLDEILAKLGEPKFNWDDTDGTGHRDGSREDVLSKRKGPVEKVAEVVKQDGGRKGILGMLMSLVGGVGGIFGALKGWMGGLYAVMRAGALTKLATSVMGLVTLFASKGKAKAAVAKGASLKALSKVGKFAGKHWGKMALGAGALMMATRQASASDMYQGAMSTMGNSDEAAYKEAIETARAIDGDDAESVDFGEERKDDEKKSFFDKMWGGATDGGMGTVLAMAAAGGLTGLFTKGKSLGGGAAPGVIGKVSANAAKSGAAGKAAASGLAAAGGLGGGAAMAAPKFVPVAPVAGGGALAAGKAGMGAVAPAVATAGKSAMAAAPSVAGAVGKEAAKKGLGSMAMGGLKSIGRNAGLLGAGFAAYDAYTTEGTMVDKGLAFGKSMLTTAAMGKAFSLGRTAMSVAGRQVLMQGGRTALMALGGALSTPVVLGALAVGAVAVGGYFAYKYFFGKDKNALARYRMAQYGIDLDNKDQAAIIIRFEGLCQKNVEVRGDKASFTRNMTPVEVMKIFGISAKDKERMEAFIAWFNNRFKPVFLNAFAAYFNQTRRKDLEKADTELDKEEKLKLLDAFAGVDKSAYDCLISPFPGGKLLKYTAKKVASAYDTAKRKIGNEKGGDKKADKDAKEDKDNKAKPYNPATATAAERFANGEYGKQRTENNKANSSGWWGDPEKAKKHVEEQQGFFSRIGNTFRDIGHSMDTGLASMSGSQKEWQLAVYNGCKTAGFSEQQARIMTAEIGRENSYDPKLLFGGHADPHKGSNLGMISWQGDRRTKLISFLAQAGALDKSGNIIPSQAAIEAQAKFMMWEMRNTHKTAGNAFLSNPNISYADGVKILGMQYIKWRFTDSKYASGHKNRDQFYNMLLKQLNAKDGDGVDETATETTQVSANANDGFDIKAAVENSAEQTGSASGGNAASSGGWFGYMTGGGSRAQSNAENIKSFGGGALGVASAGFEGVIPATATSGGVPTTHRAYRAAAYATSKAKKSKPYGDCAKYVANALVAAGYKFERQPSAYMYANGALTSAGFSKIGTNSKHQVGDIMVWPAHGKGPSSGGGKHGHIQIFNGTSWVSDFVQRTQVPGQLYSSVSPSLWRDNTLLGKAGAEADKANATAGKVEGSKVDTAAKKDSIPNTIAKPQTPAAASASTPKDTKASTQIPNVLARPQANTSSFVGGAPTSSFIPTINQPSTQERDAFPVQQPVVQQAVAQPTIDPGIARVSKLVERSTSSLLGTTAVQATQKRERDTLVSKDNELVSIGKQQLEIQTKMLQHLAEISQSIGNLSGGTPEKPKESSTSDSVAAAQAMRGKSKTVPVSMATKR